MKNFEKLQESALGYSHEPGEAEAFTSIVGEAVQFFEKAMRETGWPGWRASLFILSQGMTREVLPNLTKAMASETQTMMRTQLPRLLKRLCLVVASNNRTLPQQLQGVLATSADRPRRSNLLLDPSFRAPLALIHFS